jgi:hypothetical protein
MRLSRVSAPKGADISELKRKIAFTSAAFVLLGITAVLTLGDPVSLREGDAHTQRSAGPSPIRTGPPAVPEPGGPTDPRGSPSPAPPAPSTAPSPPGVKGDEAEARSAPAVAPGDARAATAAARAFLEGYLPYSYGRARAQRIRAAAIPLLRELEASPPRVPASIARARPRLVSVHAEAATGDSGVNVVAVVEDGRRRYRIPLAVRNTGRRWVVTAVSG